MKIVKIKGGLGNQMFQYSFAILLKEMTDENVKIDMTDFDNCINDEIRKPRLLKYNISLPIASPEEIKKIRKFQIKNNPLKYIDKSKIVFECLLNHNYFWEVNRKFRQPKKLLHYSYFDGYWQSWRYVDSIRNQLVTEFTPNYQLHTKTLCLQEKMKTENSVFIGVRRGDYELDKKHFGVFDGSYYNTAIKVIMKAVTNPVFYIFSNDVNWCKNNLNFEECNVNYREKENIIDDFEELQLMISCKHAIIGNSTFHWWGAWLISNPQKIIVAPKNWFFDDKPIDIVQPNWIKLEKIGESDDYREKKI